MHSNNPDGYYMYYKNIGISPAFKEHKKEYLAGLIASIVALGALSRFAIKKITPRSAVEVADKALGLNKPGINQEFAERVKDKILLPIVSVKKGQWKMLFEENFANGMIVAGEGAEFNSKALIEHAEELGIQCLKLNPNVKGKQNIISNIYKIVAEAKDAIRFNRKNCVIIDIGNLDKAFTMSKSKLSTKEVSKIENTLTTLPRGIIWSGWTTNTEKIPYYYNNTPTQVFMLS